MRISVLFALTLLITAALQPVGAALRINPSNPRYFIDQSGNAVRLAGHQIFVDLQDNTFNKNSTYDGAHTLDWSWYLDFATTRGMNFIRDWIIWSFGSGSMADDNNAVANPMMYERTGPGTAADGGPKFDLTRFDEAFFDRLHQRLLNAQERGIYVSIMLFEVYGFLRGEEVNGQALWDGNVFNGTNNVNGIDLDSNGDGRGLEFFYGSDPAVLALQQDFVRKVIDTVNDLDNVLYEVANEVYAPSWQYDMVSYIKSYEATKPKQHPVYLSGGGVNSSGGYTTLSLDELAGSEADCFAAWQAWDDFSDPPVYTRGKPVFWDNDHMWIAGWDHHSIPWKAFTRGYHYTLYDHPFEKPATESQEWERIRYNVGATNQYAARVPDLAALEPRGDLSSTGYNLADPGVAYIVYQPASDTTFTLNLEAKTYDFEWFDPGTYQVAATGSLTSGGGSEPFRAPFSGDAVLFLLAAPLGFTMTANPDPVHASNQVFYELTVSNQGSAQLTNVVLNSLTPNLTEVRESDLTGDGDCVPSNVCYGGDSIQWLLGTLAPGETRTVLMAPTLLGTDSGVTDGTLIHNAATVTYDGGSVSLARDVVVDNSAPIGVLDVDGDGLTNDVETLIGTNLLLWDTDGDTLSDFAEVAYDGDPDSYVAGQDLNPFLTDTDGDGLTDDADPIPLNFNYADGDVAPQGQPDGQLNAADLLIMQQFVLGMKIPSNDELAHGDLYPSGAPDGIMNLSDLILLQQLIMQP